VAEIIETEDYARVHLKGYAEEFELIRYRQHRPLEHWLEQTDLSLVENVTYYRSAEDLCKVLRFLHQPRNRINAHKCFALIACLQKVQRNFYQPKWAKPADGAVAEELIRLLEDLVKDGLQRDEAKPTSRLSGVKLSSVESDSKRAPETAPEAESVFAKGSVLLVSATCSLLKNLLTREEFKAHVAGDLLRWLEYPEPRVVANMIAVINHFQDQGSEDLIEKLVDHPNVRLASNAMVHQGRLRFGAEVLRRLKSMLKSTQPEAVAAGLYALGEIAEFHRLADPVFYRSQIELRDLVDSIPDYLEAATDERVLRQAREAARKCGLSKSA
jgi:hypothetical protein